MPRDMNKPAALPKESTLKLMKRLIKTYVKPYTGSLAIAIFFMMIAAAMTAAVAKLMQPILDDVLAGSKMNMIVPIGLMVLGTFAVRGISTYLHTIIMNKVGHRIIGDIQRDLFSHFMILDLAFFHANPSGQLISRVINDVSVLRTTISEIITNFGKSLLTLIFLVGVMFYQDWKLSLIAFGIFPFISLVVANIGRRLRKVSRSIQNETGILSDRLSQIFQGIRQVKAYGTETHENLRAGAAIDKVRSLHIKSVHIGNMLTPLNEIIIGAVFCGIIIYGGYQTTNGEMTAGQLASFLAAFSLAYEPMKKLARLHNTVQMGLGAADRIFTMMNLKPEIFDNPGAETLHIQSPEISFDQVSFGYNSDEIRALENISFTAKPGTVTALVGPSGGGKSTIINLIPRFYDTGSGSISIDGHDVKNVTLESLRKNIALVSQDITIFDDSVEANIAYGSSGKTHEQVQHAAKAAAAHDFIENLDNGYETRLGEDGVKLSGGQRQRIAIARAILRDAPILLLDEATSALDNESEKLVQNAFAELQKGRTTIVIAHRLSTVQSADNIIVLDKGQIIEQGRHDDLMNANGLYAKMYRAGFKE